MSEKIIVLTAFDCTPSGVKSYRKNIDLDNEQYQMQRNQQRNWDTMIQCFSLRCQPLNISTSICDYQFNNDKTEPAWLFQFEVDRDGIFATQTDPLGILKEDLKGVPMISGLTETRSELFLTPYLVIQGDLLNTVVMNTD